MAFAKPYYLQSLTFNSLRKDFANIASLKVKKTAGIAGLTARSIDYMTMTGFRGRSRVKQW